jgi:chromosome segregation ATPase
VQITADAFVSAYKARLKDKQNSQTFVNGKLTVPIQRIDPDKEVARVLSKLDRMVAIGFQDLPKQGKAPAVVILAALEAILKHRGHLVRLEGETKYLVEWKPKDENFLELAANEMQQRCRHHDELRDWERWVKEVWNTVTETRVISNKKHHEKRKRVTEELTKALSEQNAVIASLRETLHATQEQVAAQHAQQVAMQQAQLAYSQQQQVHSQMQQYQAAAPRYSQPSTHANKVAATPGKTSF